MSADASAESERTTETIPEWKREEVDAIVEMLEAYDSVGVVDITGIPSRQLQDMRSELWGTAELRVSRNTLLERALEEVDDGFERLTAYLTGHVGLIGTNDNPFGLYRQLETSKTPAPINAGEVAPNDVVVPEGDTGVDPGPFVGELQNVGAAARIDEGSIKVTEDSTVLEAGEEVSAELANVLAELGIEPKEVGLDLRAVYADGVLFEPEELEIDVEEYRSDVATATARGRNLAVSAAVPTDATAKTLLQTARGDAKALAVHASIEDPDVVPELVNKADAQVQQVVAQIDDQEALPEELQDVDAPAAGAGDAADADGTDAADGAEDAAGDDADDASDAADESDDEGDDGDDAGDALGEMF